MPGSKFPLSSGDKLSAAPAAIRHRRQRGGSKTNRIQEATSSIQNGERQLQSMLYSNQPHQASAFAQLPQGIPSSANFGDDFYRVAHDINIHGDGVPPEPVPRKPKNAPRQPKESTAYDPGIASGCLEFVWTTLTRIRRQLLHPASRLLVWGLRHCWPILLMLVVIAVLLVFSIWHLCLPPWVSQFWTVCHLNQRNPLCSTYNPIVTQLHFCAPAPAHYVIDPDAFLLPLEDIHDLTGDDTDDRTRHLPLAFGQLFFKIHEYASYVSFHDFENASALVSKLTDLADTTSEVREDIVGWLFLVRYSRREMSFETLSMMEILQKEYLAYSCGYIRWYILAYFWTYKPTVTTEQLTLWINHMTSLYNLAGEVRSGGGELTKKLDNLENDFVSISKSTVKEIERRRRSLRHEKRKSWFTRNTAEIAEIESVLDDIAIWKGISDTVLHECTQTRDIARGIQKRIEILTPQLLDARTWLNAHKSNVLEIDGMTLKDMLEALMKEVRFLIASEIEVTKKSRKNHQTTRSGGRGSLDGHGSLLLSCGGCCNTGGED
ncbi:uncharacterized protein BP5553_07601 [Venustampulla echinocandica]|uniref:Uncharacterized protein n=1 Tax=Venustampulla echinocandica TaxID=2656787 RepID=A0A370TH12_9HELO|nr:uncharacterized protein BP5553_07601 [Venustampulla echinocandica]RDL34473.1 hypothetical protein BP5553_07601 [Venustampulla echinocandica]